MKINFNKTIQLTGFLTCLGYALMHFCYRDFNLWKIYPSASVKLILRNFNLSTDIVFLNGSPTAGFLLFLNLTGLVFTISSILCLVSIVKEIKFPSFIYIFHYISSLLITAHAFASLIHAKLHYNVPFEYAIRISIPILCVIIGMYAIHKSRKDKLFARILPIAIAFTFAAHGLYAMRILPIPQSFLLMTSNILNTPRSISLNILFIAGVIDVLLAIGIFIPKIRIYFICYAIFWGFLTSLARLVAYYDPSFLSNYFTVWIPQFLVRTGHFLIPLAYLVFINQYKSPNYTT